MLSNAFISDYSVEAGEVPPPGETLTLMFQNLEFVHTVPLEGAESGIWALCD